MELRIVGDAIELAEFLKALGTSTLQIKKPESIVANVDTVDTAKDTVKATVKSTVKPVASTGLSFIPSTLEEDGKIYIPLSDIAKRYGKTRQTIINWSHAGLPCTRHGKFFYFCVDDVDAWIAEHHGKNGVKYSKKRKMSETAFAQWKLVLTDMCRDANKDEGKMLSLTYKYMTKNYGIVWEQFKKDYYKSEGHYPHSTSQLAYWIECSNPIHRGLTASCLRTVLSEETK